jgi:hemerythrin-like domain-containing protein
MAATKILPVGPLMQEHRTIEKMIEYFRREIGALENGEDMDTDFIFRAIDLMRTFADRCHHGKEEDILFKELEKKNISEEHERIIRGLKEDHVRGRQLIGDLEEARRRNLSGEAESVSDAAEIMKELCDIYPRHIKTEDKDFFLPCMEYFEREELDKMLEDFEDKEKMLLHEKYNGVIKEMEKRRL